MQIGIVPTLPLRKEGSDVVLHAIAHLRIDSGCLRIRQHDLWNKQRDGGVPVLESQGRIDDQEGRRA